MMYQIDTRLGICDNWTVFERHLASNGINFDFFKSDEKIPFVIYRYIRDKFYIYCSHHPFYPIRPANKYLTAFRAYHYYDLWGARGGTVENVRDQVPYHERRIKILESLCRELGVNFDNHNFTLSI